MELVTSASGCGRKHPSHRGEEWLVNLATRFEPFQVRVVSRWNEYGNANAIRNSPQQASWVFLPNMRSRLRLCYSGTNRSTKHAHRAARRCTDTLAVFRSSVAPKWRTPPASIRI